MSSELTLIGEFVVTVQPDGHAFVAQMAYPDNRFIDFGYARARAFFTLPCSSGDEARSAARKIIESGQMK